MRECCACFCAVASKTGKKLPSVFLIKKYSHRSVFFGVSSYILVILNVCLFHLLRFFPPYSCHFFLNKETKPFIFLWLQVYSISLVIFSVPATCVSCFLCCLIWIKKNKLLKGKRKSFYFDTRDVFNNPINFWVVNEASRWGHITVEFMPTAYTNLWDWLTRTGIKIVGRIHFRAFLISSSPSDELESSELLEDESLLVLSLPVLLLSESSLPESGKN